MDEYLGIHAGHRERMYDKLLVSPDSLSEHEYLEVLLFAFIPRKNTNPLAHKLIRTFGSLSGVFNASAKELMSIDGIGKSVASQIVAFGKILQKVNTNKEKTFTWSSITAHSSEIISWFENQEFEKFILVLISANDKEIAKISFDGSSVGSVDASIAEIMHAIAIHKPKKIVIAHNHPSGNVQPSSVDDYATMRLKVICAFHGIQLKDHVIVYGNEVFSYMLTDRLSKVGKLANIDNIIRNIKE